MILSGDLMQAISTAWTDQGLDTLFKSLWSASERDDYASLNFFQAGPNTPIPYGILEIGETTTQDRMSGTSSDLRDIRRTDFVLSANVINRQATLGTGHSDPRTQKEIAADMAEEIMKVYGGHDEQSPVGLTLATGCFIDNFYQRDFGIQMGDRYTWRVEYRVLLDVPVVL